MDSSAVHASCERIPKPGSRVPKNDLVNLIFGDKDDPLKPPRQSRYKSMRNLAKQTYHRVIVPQKGASGPTWDQLESALQEQAIEDLLQDGEYKSYFERSDDLWLPKYLLSTYIKHVLDHQNDVKKKKSGSPGQSSGNQPSEPGPSRVVGERSVSG
ncbi:hypothetical protein TWF281_002145 [Arthrobotrys megalospora]